MSIIRMFFNIFLYLEKFVLVVQNIFLNNIWLAKKVIVFPKKKISKISFFWAMQLHITLQIGLVNIFVTMRHICDTVDYSHMLITTYQLLITHYVFYMYTSEYVRHIM